MEQSWWFSGHHGYLQSDNPSSNTAEALSKMLFQKNEKIQKEAGLAHFQ